MLNYYSELKHVWLFFSPSDYLLFPLIYLI